MQQSTNTPVGFQLAQAREKLDMSSYDVISILKIKLQIIQMIENDSYPTQTIDIFLKGHIMAYCKLLKVNPQTIINHLEAKGYDFPKQQASTEKKPSKKSSYTRSMILLTIPIAIVLMLPKPETKPTNEITRPIILESLNHE